MEKKIRFIDSNYNELFRVADGEQIMIKMPDGTVESRTCKYLDEYHTIIDDNCYHIRQWVELMERNGNTYMPASEYYKEENLKFVKENYNAICVDKFYKTDYGVKEVYYNPDSSAGGQLVYNEISFDLIREAANFKSTQSFFNHLTENCKQYLVDIDTPEFKDYCTEFIERKADFEDCNEDTMCELIKYDLHNQLFDKICAEQDKFVNNLKMTAEEVIKKAYEFVTKEDIVMSLNEPYLSADEMRALLKLDYPLDFLYERWLKIDCSYMENLRCGIENIAKDYAKSYENKSKPVENTEVFEDEEMEL